MGKKIAIIGAGIAGLSAGCYLRMNGFDTEIFELHSRPGGVCTAWKRNDYTFDGCLYWLVGSKDGSFHKVWSELGALPGPRIVNHDEFMRIEGKDGKVFVLYLDPDRLEHHLMELSPADADNIEFFCNGIRLLRDLDMPLGPPRSMDEARDSLKLIPGLGKFLLFAMRNGNLTVGDFAGRFRDPFLREAFRRISDHPDFVLVWLLASLAWMSAGNAGYPVGGSLEFARTIERRYLDLGGSISYKSRVTEIVIKGYRASGIVLEDGTAVDADAVISAADLHSTMFGMLGGQFVTPKMQKMFDDWPLFPPLVQVSLGVKRDLSKEPHAVQFVLDQPIDTGGKEHTIVHYIHYCFDPMMAPEGRSVVIMRMTAGYEHWARLREDKAAYEAEKKRIADEVVEVLDERWPGFKDDVDVIDVATPMTFVRYTENWKASYEGWLPVRMNARTTLTGIKKTLPAIEDFYMIGQWLAPGGGVPPAGLHGRQVAQMICRKDGRKFETSMP